MDYKESEKNLHYSPIFFQKKGESCQSFHHMFLLGAKKNKKTTHVKQKKKNISTWALHFVESVICECVFNYFLCVMIFN